MGPRGRRPFQRKNEAGELPLSFVFEFPDRPQPRRDQLQTLEDWELWLAWEVRKVQLLGELDLTEGEYRCLTRLLSDLVKRVGAKQVVRGLALHYPITLCAFLVTHGTYGFREGDFWGGIRKQTGALGGSDWGRIFEETLKGLGLPRFPGLGGYRYVTPILIHSGIPDYCLPDFFRSVLLPSVTRPRYEVLDAEDLVDALLDRAEVKFFADKPVQRFLQHGGSIALDFLKRCRVMAEAYVDTGVTPDPDALGLPRRVVGAFAEWVSSQENMDRARNTGEHTRLRRPRIGLDPWADGIFLAFPRQDLPASFLRRNLRCVVSEGETQLAAFALRLRSIGGEVRTDEVRRPLPQVSHVFTIILMDDTEAVRRWNLRLGGTELPLLAFDPENGDQVAWDTSLPADRLWLLYPKTWKLQETVRCLERFESVPGEWGDYCGGEYDLHGLDRLRISAEGVSREVLLTRSELGQRPRLVGGAVFPYDADLRESPLYIGSPPELYLPLVRKDLAPGEQLTRWRLRLSSEGPVTPALETRLGLGEVASAVRHEGQGMIVHLSDGRLLGPSPSGAYQLAVQGPLGLDAEFRLRVWPELRTEGLQSLYLPGEEKAAGIEFQLGVPQGSLVESAGGSEAAIVLRVPLQAPGLAWHAIRVPDRDPEVHLHLVQLKDGNEQSRLRLRVSVPWLRWSVQGVGEGYDSEEWTTSPVRLPLEMLIEGTGEHYLLVDLPPQSQERVSMGLKLWDAHNHLVQQGKMQTTRGGKRRSWRFPLTEFRDTLRDDRSSSFRFSLVVAGLGRPETETHVLTVVRSAKVSDVSLVRTAEGENETWRLTWTQTRQVGDRRVRLWHAWQPWRPPLVLCLPDNALQEFTFMLPGRVIGDGRLLADFYVQDAWVSSHDHPETAWGCRSHPHVLDLVPPEERLRDVEGLLARNPSDFNLHFERACILTGIERDEARAEISWCIEHLALAEPATALSLWSWLHDQGAHEQCDLLSAAMAEPRMAQRMAKLKEGDSGRSRNWERYLEVLRSVGDMPLETAQLLLAVREDAVWAQAARTLIAAEDPRGFEEIITRLRRHLISPDQALLFLSVNSDFSSRMLETLWPEPLAVSLLKALSPSQVIDRGHWIRTKAGWGQVVDIVNPDGQPGGSFLEGTAAPRLRVVLRKGEEGREEWAEVNLQEGTVSFPETDKLWFCRKCCAFFSRNPQWIAGSHNVAAHEGMGAHVDKTSTTKIDAGPIRFDARRPRKIWE